MELKVRSKITPYPMLPKLAVAWVRIDMNYYIKKNAVEKIWGSNVKLEKIKESRYETALLKAMDLERVNTNWWLNINSPDDLFPEPGEECIKIGGEICFTLGPCRQFTNPDHFVEDVKRILADGTVRPYASWKKYSYYERHVEYYRSHNLPVGELLALDKSRIADIPIEEITEALSRNKISCPSGCNCWFFQYIIKCMQLQNAQNP